MQPVEAEDELEALAGLREHERELDQQLEDARQEGARLLAAAHQAADRLRQESEAELLGEVQRLRREAGVELAHALAGVKQETARRSDALGQTAERNRERTRTFLLSRVTGKETT